MPLNILRLNQRKLHPNDRITFIKPLPGPDAATAEDFLSRLAAQCLPVMRANQLSITTLEEYEPNREFLGRNFNAGEVVQLVLKSRAGRWLPFRHVQMVMMHELAHCVQMNHSRAFWAVRNAYAGEMRELWAKGYTGEGMWGRGRALYDGQIGDGVGVDGGDVPEHLCGGTYRSRGRTRKRKQELSYQEKKERRIKKKFGAGGEKLGDDEVLRRGLENGRWSSNTKPRVAKSKRGRELRATALLDRLEKEKSEEQSDQNETQEEEETESEYEEEAAEEGQESVELGGRHMVKVCEDENMHGDADAMQELAELNNLPPAPEASSSTDADDTLEPAVAPPKSRAGKEKAVFYTEIDLDDYGDDDDEVEVFVNPTSTPKVTVREPPKRAPVLKLRPSPSASPPASEPDQTCNICSLSNSPYALLCAACANVLDTDRLPRHWRCQSEICRDSKYVNADDSGRCGVCGAANPSAAGRDGGEGSSLGGVYGEISNG